jgi:TMP repeat
MQKGGYLIAFVSQWSATRGNLRNEVLKALELRPSNVLLAWLDDPRSNRMPGVDIPPERQIYLHPNSEQVRAPARERKGFWSDIKTFVSGKDLPIQTEGYWPDIKTIVSGKNLPVLSRDVDDLVVRVYWMRKSSTANGH